MFLAQTRFLTRKASYAAAGPAWTRWPPWSGGCYRGIAELTGLTLAAEVADFRRFASALAFTGFAGLTPSEYCSGARTRRGGITKADPQLIRSTLIEAAWACRHRPAIGATPRRRQAGCPEQTLARSWKAQQRLHATYAKLTGAGRSPRWRSPRSPASSPGSSGPR